jgi:lysophospholipase L1-like esterase
VIVAAPPPPPPPPPPRLTVTKFLAFGDSLTEGKTALASGVLMLTLPDAYTFKLQDLLARRYTTQAFSVVNEGLGGESTLQGKRRLPGTLASLQPEVVLLMEGANDLLAFGNNGVRDAIDNLGDMISLGQSAGARVLIATLPPQRPDSLRGTAAAVVPAFNDGIRHIAAQQNAVLVDVFAAFRGDLSLVGPDGLHLNELGYQRIAEAFFDVIRTRFELTPQTRVHYGDFSIRAAR